MKPKNHKELSEREMAILRYGIAFDITSPAILYRLANDGSTDGAVGTRWMQSKKVQDFLRRERSIWEDRQEKERQKVEAETLQRIAAKQNGTITKDDSGLIDYSDFQNQLAKLNELINTGTDADSVLDALKVMIAANAKNAEAKEAPRQIRVFLPLNCSDCPLYAQERERLEQKKK